MHGIAVERYAVLKASFGTETLLQDITDRERKVAEHSDYGCFFTEQHQLLQPLNLTYNETKMVLGELWVLRGETGRQPYASQAVQEGRESDARRKIAGFSAARKEDTPPPCVFTFDHPPVNPGDEIGFCPLRNADGELPETAFILISGKLLWG